MKYIPNSLDFLTHVNSPEELSQLLNSGQPESNENSLLLKSMWEVATIQEKEVLANVLFKVRDKSNTFVVEVDKIQNRFRKSIGKALMFFTVLTTAYRSFNHITDSFYKIAARRTAPQRKPGNK